MFWAIRIWLHARFEENQTRSSVNMNALTKEDKENGHRLENQVSQD